MSVPKTKLQPDKKIVKRMSCEEIMESNPHILTNNQNNYENNTIINDFSFDHQQNDDENLNEKEISSKDYKNFLVF